MEDTNRLGIKIIENKYSVKPDAPYDRSTVRPCLQHSICPSRTSWHIYPSQWSHTHVQSDPLQCAHDKNLRVFHEVRQVEQALIQQIVTAVEEQYIIAMLKNCDTGQFIGNVLQIFQYLQNTYGTISPSQLSQFEKDVTEMHYDPVTPVDNIFNKVEDLLEYGDLVKPFSQPQAIAKAYNLINATGKFCEAVKA